MLHAQNFNKSLWAEAMVDAVYTQNRCPIRTLDFIRPEEAWSGRRPCIAHMRVFGCVAYAIMHDEQRDKLDAKGINDLFLDYCEGIKAYRLMCLQNKKIIICRDMVFMDDDTSIRNTLEMRPRGRNEGLMTVVVNKSRNHLCVMIVKSVMSK